MRKTITMPESTVKLVREQQRADESFSATVTRLVEEGARLVAEGKAPSWTGSAEGGPDLSLRDEEILREIFSKL